MSLSVELKHPNCEQLYIERKQRAHHPFVEMDHVRIRECQVNVFEDLSEKERFRLVDVGFLFGEPYVANTCVSMFKLAVAFNAFEGCKSPFLVLRYSEDTVAVS